VRKKCYTAPPHTLYTTTHLIHHHAPPHTSYTTTHLSIERTARHASRRCLPRVASDVSCPSMLSLSLALSLSVSLSLSLFRTLPLSLSESLSLARSLSLSCARALSLSESPLKTPRAEGEEDRVNSRVCVLVHVLSSVCRLRQCADMWRGVSGFRLCGL